MQELIISTKSAHAFTLFAKFVALKKVPYGIINYCIFGQEHLTYE